jgi:signal peptidase I
MADTQARNLPAPDAADEPPGPEPSSSTAQDGDPSTREDRGRTRRFVGSTPFLILVALAIAIVVKSFLVQAFYIPSASMEPTLAIGDRVFVNKLAYDLGDVGRGDVIVFENPSPGAVPDRGVVDGFLHWLGEGIGVAQPENEDFIKRVVGLPGETIEIRDDVVYIDGEPLDEPYLTRRARAQTGDYPLTEIPEDALFMMGDNRANSLDSRFSLGFVPVDAVVGQAFVIIWPPSDIGGVG